MRRPERDGMKTDAREFFIKKGTSKKNRVTYKRKSSFGATRLGKAWHKRVGSVKMGGINKEKIRVA